MDIQKVFESISVQLIAEFNKSAQVKHPGGKGDLREDAFRAFLGDYLPRRYGVGRGEVITAENRVSGELDIVIYDVDHSPLFIKSSSHSVYPGESVYGAFSMKSHLDHAELKDAYANIVSVKKILPKSSFTLYPTPGLAMGMGAPVPVTGIIAYAANRSLDAISEQVNVLDAELEDINLRPDFVAVLGVGIVGPRDSIRTKFNAYKLPQEKSQLGALRKTGRHTLFRIYMQVLRELNTITLRPLDLQDYLDMPRLVGKYRVKRHNRFVATPLAGSVAEVRRFNLKAIEEIANNSRVVTYEQHLYNAYGVGPAQIKGIESSGIDLTAPVYEYNPRKLPPISLAAIKRDGKGRVYHATLAFQPYPLVIDDKDYAVDVSSLGDEMFEVDPDYTVDELMSS